MNANVIDSDSPAAVITRRIVSSHSDPCVRGGLCSRENRKGHRQLVVSEVPSDFFDQVDLARDIGTEGGDRNGPQVPGSVGP